MAPTSMPPLSTWSLITTSTTAFDLTDDIVSYAEPSSGLMLRAIVLLSRVWGTEAWLALIVLVNLLSWAIARCSKGGGS